MAEKCSKNFPKPAIAAAGNRVSLPRPPWYNRKRKKLVNTRKIETGGWNKTAKKRFFPALLLTLVLALSLTPISAFADGVNYMQKVKVAYTHIGYKAGDTPRKTASVTEGNCTVAYEYWREIYQKVEGGVWSGTGRYWYSDSEKMASLAEDKHITQFEAGHHYSYNIVLVANSGYFFSDEETVVSVGDYEWGTPSNHTNLEIKEMSTQLRVCGIYAVDLPDESQSTTISAAAIENVKFDYQPGDAPRATAKRAANQYNYDILYECWQQFENNQPVAAWYSDNDSHGSLPTITAFENGKTYVYSIMLKPKDGYSFSSETVITVNGNAVTAGPATDGYLSLPNVKTITPTEQITPPATGGYYYSPSADGSSASPKTTDPGMALYAAAALLSTAGLAWNGRRRGQ